MIGDDLSGLFAGLFTDASMFPPVDAQLPAALHGHVQHQLAWYGEMTAPLVCLSGRLRSLEEICGSSGVTAVEVSVVSPEGLNTVAEVADQMRGCRRVFIRSIEVPLYGDRVHTAVQRLAPYVTGDCAVYLEIPCSELSPDHVHLLARGGIGVKLRAGWTSLHEFQNEAILANAIVLCAAERLPFTCVSGLRRAVRHRDPDTLAQQHGYLNIALAARAAAGTGSVATTQAILAERDPAAIRYGVSDLTARDVTAIRALLHSCATTSVGESVSDLVALGLVAAP